MVNYVIPPNIQETMRDGMAARALAESLAHMNRPADSSGQCVHEEPQQAETSGFWVFTLLVAISVAICSLFTKSENGDIVAVPPDTAGNPPANG